MRGGTRLKHYEPPALACPAASRRVAEAVVRTAAIVTGNDEPPWTAMRCEAGYVRTAPERTTA